ncbi:S8 family serine peptidase [Reichenbachiella versicolor]|uniref:S8 family serine peptidase n=1 Tax=Reichenbachiella versicolor TaxID=1821036 RepID=UPI000D6E240D|nr:S8 family serine peptidase [Reichenbachiella versicolor]
MKNRFTNWKILIIFLFGISLNAIAQTDLEKSRIQKNSNYEKLQDMKKTLASEAKKQQSKAIKQAKKNGWVVRETTKDGAIIELHKVENGKPIYFKTDNANAAVSTRVNHLNSGGSLRLSLDGKNMTAHVWDGGVARPSHQEYDGPGGTDRFSIGDGSNTLNFHAAHVTGTIMASGVVPEARGMAPSSKVIGSDWNADLAEMASAASDGMILSNHSYGYGTRDDFGNVVLPQHYFGGYIEESRDIDEIMFNAPYYLMVSSAGNDGEDDTANEDPTGGFGFDKLTAYSTAKNNLVIASARDAVINADGSLDTVAISAFSSEGPTDDFRIKPDIAGNGQDVFSSYHAFDSHYATISGTSMSSPNVTGSLLLLQEHHNNLNGTMMKAATLKGLALHTADDAGVPGPDAVFGWGLLNTKKAAEAISGKGSNTIIRELFLSSGQTYSFTVKADADSSTPLMASISWTDRAGEPNTIVNSTVPVLVNDLDIRVSKGGAKSFPYRLTGALTNSRSDNTVDPFERVDVDNASGMYTVTISHKGSLEGGSQDYSIIITGVEVNEFTCDARVPTGLEFSNSVLSWDLVPKATYTIKYRKKGTADWTVVSSNKTSIPLEDLEWDTQYEAHIKSTCSNSKSSAYTAPFKFTTAPEPPISYCNTRGLSVADEWIDMISFAGMENTSGSDGGYADFTSSVATVTKGESYVFTARAGFAGIAYTDHFKAWIDYDQNGVFEDSEEIFAEASSSTVDRIGSVTIPVSALEGDTRMRVSMKYNADPNPCETFQYGEVEDYTVKILGSGARASSNARSIDGSSLEQSFGTIVTISPNPAKDYLTIEGFDTPKSVQVYSSTGVKIHGCTLTESKVDISSLSQGIYLIIVEMEGGTFKTRFIKE